MLQQHTTRRGNGEYVTTRMPNGVIETCWFPDDPNKPSRVIGRTMPRLVEDVASEHIAAYEDKPSSR